MENQTLTLAPAAGGGIGKAVADRLLARSDFLQLMEDAAVCGLTANLPPRWDSQGKCWGPEMPDAKTRVTTWLGILAHMEGDPIKRIIHQHTGDGGKLDVAAALRESPELLSALRREAEKAEWRTSGHQKHKRPAKQVEAMEVEGEAGPKA